jgi:alpha/beta hydrolase family protein
LANFPEAEFVTFPWSGRNSAAARLKAAKSLAEVLRKLNQEHRQAHHFIIAHSHGGNIACYAAQSDGALREPIDGVVCLSTPFLNVQPKNLTFFGKFAWLAVMYVSGLMTMALIGGLFVGLFERITPTAWSLWTWVDAIGEMVFNVSLLPGVIIVLTLAIWVERSCLKMGDAMRLRSERLPQLLLVRTAADEASAALILFQIGNWLMQKILAMTLLPLLIVEWAHQCS